VTKFDAVLRTGMPLSSCTHGFTDTPQPYKAPTGSNGINLVNHHNCSEGPWRVTGLQQVATAPTQMPVPSADLESVHTKTVARADDNCWTEGNVAHEYVRAVPTAGTNSISYKVKAPQPQHRAQ
jgi:hypothetical protein